ncbi:unnamed protein product [Candidula unifasciata]|uniref:TM2 domain-containing protein n=1 Tax=Candidula unifasciata TaxID=100452 RepID=A0A8S3YT78_9EUPU|nr:unnamed protein product [Candidula unifasciata]
MLPKTSHDTEQTVLTMRTLVSWHLLSVFLLILTVMPGEVTPDLDVTTTPDNSSGNGSENTSGPRAVECRISVEECIDCDFNVSCLYGTKQRASCMPKPSVNCSGSQKFEREYDCLCCYQLPRWDTWCNQTVECALNKPRNYYPARPFFVSTCWAKSQHLCMGRRCFHKQIPCNWSQGYKWSTALLLSIFLGGFGVDRFYLGLWIEGIGKLLSFGGLGVWTLVDVILIAVGYVGPWDGSLYI